MRIVDPGARVSVVAAFVLLVVAAYALTAVLLDLAVDTGTGPAINIAPIANAVLFVTTLGGVAFCVRTFRGRDEPTERPVWRMTEGAVGGVVGAASFFLLALLWWLANASGPGPIAASGIVVFGAIAVAFALSTARLVRADHTGPDAVSPR